MCEHYGIVGERGVTKQHGIAKGGDEGDAIWTILRPAAEAGYQPISRELFSTLLIEYTIEGIGESSDLVKRHALETRKHELSAGLVWGMRFCQGL